MRWGRRFNSKRPGPAANSDRKVALIRSATTAASTLYNSGGGMKSRGPRARPVTLPTLETARELTKERAKETAN